MSSTSYPPEPTPKGFAHLLSAFNDYSLSHGLTVRPAPSFVENPKNAIATAAPVSLYPTLFPRSCFDNARRVQPAYNSVYASVASDDVWLGELVSSLAAVDSFMKQLYDVYLDVKSEGFVHEYSLGLFRSDYMVHQPTPTDEPIVHQVEFNTIASSFGGLASRVSELHRFLALSGAYPPHPQLIADNIPVNPAASKLADGLAAGHKAYGPAALEGRETAVLFIVQPNERNAFDQRWLEYNLLENHGIRAYRVSLDEIPSTTVLEDRRLIYTTPQDTKVEVSVVYFRAGYGPDDYPTEKEWEARKHLERSRAIKCPTIATQLAGAKKVQQELAVPGVLERFCAKEEVAGIRGTFAAIYPLDSTPQGMVARKLAFEQPEKYVLKPQREGGGNNVYRGKIPRFLQSIGEDKWSAYILMELIEPPPAKGVIVRHGEAMRGEVIAELGVYGVALWDMKGELKVNNEAGWLLRTKGSDSEEGGVAAGFGCVDGVCLV
ncbi:glutathione synthase [Pyronema omphalodes]|nr:glutathione synthase [Pyronema omphalodes]